MKRFINICEQHGIALCYLFGSQQERGKAILAGEKVPVVDEQSDIDFAVLFRTLPASQLELYARLSLDLQDLVAPHRADLLFLHEVDHLVQLEAIRGINAYSFDPQFRENYEERVMKFAADELQIFKRNESDFFGAVKDGYFEFEYQAA
jgi:predicted nucleotidyltransferase